MPNETQPNAADQLQEAIDRLTSTLREKSASERRGLILPGDYNKSSSGLILPQQKIIIAAPSESRGPSSSAAPGYDKLRSGLLLPSAALKLPESKAPSGYDQLRSGLVVPQGPTLRQEYRSAPPPPPRQTPYTPPAEQNFAAREAKRRAYMAVQASGKSPPETPAPRPVDGHSLDSEAKKTAAGFGILNTKMLAFAAIVGTAIKGLSGTKEGYLLDYSIQHVFFEIADMLRAPIRIITREIEGFARVLRAVNGQANGGNGLLNPFPELETRTKDIANQQDATEQNKQNLFANRAGTADVGARNHDEKSYEFGMRQMQEESDRLGRSIARDKAAHPFAVDVGFNGIGWHKSPDEDLKRQYDLQIEKTKRLHDDMKDQPGQKTPKQGPISIARAPDAKTKPDPHLQPALSVTYGDVIGLQAQMQKLATENPAQEKGLSIIENIYNVLVSINNNLPGGTKMQPLADPALRAK